MYTLIIKKKTSYICYNRSGLKVRPSHRRSNNFPLAVIVIQTNKIVTFIQLPFGFDKRTQNAFHKNNVVKYIYTICSVLFYWLEIRLLSWNKKTTVSNDTRLQLSCVNSPESAFCDGTGVENGKYCVCLRNPKSAMISDYSSELTFLN